MVCLLGELKSILACIFLCLEIGKRKINKIQFSERGEAFYGEDLAKEIDLCGFV